MNMQPGRPPFRDLTADEIDAKYQAELKRIRQSGHHRIEDQVTRTKGNTHDFSVRLGMRSA